MICPQCGYDMGNKSKCLRCGYEVKTLSVVTQKDEREQDAKEQGETIDIDPCNVFLTHPYGYEDDFGTGFGSPFVSIIDSLFGDPIGDLLGGLFGFGMSPRHQRREEPPPPRKKKQGPIVVVDDIEIIEPDKEKEAKEEKQKDDEQKDNGEPQKQKSESKIKNMFKRNNNRK